MRRLSTTALAVMATVVASTVAVAQSRPVPPPRPNRAGPPVPMNPDSQPPRDRRAGPGGLQVTPGMGGPASHLLRMREQLELTDDQVKKLEGLQSSPQPTLNEAEMLRARADLMDATKGDVSLEKARAAFDRMARVQTDAQIAQLKSRQELRNVLTLPQRTQFDAMSRNMYDRRGDAMRGRVNQRIGQRRGQQFRRQNPGQGRAQFDPGMGQGMGQGMGPGMRRGMAPGMGQGPGPGIRRRMNVPANPPRPPADTAR